MAGFAKKLKASYAGYSDEQKRAIRAALLRYDIFPLSATDIIRERKQDAPTNEGELVFGNFINNDDQKILEIFFVLLGRVEEEYRINNLEDFFAQSFAEEVASVEFFARELPRESCGLPGEELSSAAMGEISEEIAGVVVAFPEIRKTNLVLNIQARAKQSEIGEYESVESTREVDVGPPKERFVVLKKGRRQ